MQNRSANGVSKQDVLIVSDDGEFAREILARWQMEQQLPAFTLVTSEMCQSSRIAAFDLAIVGPIDQSLGQLVRSLGPDRPVLCVVSAAAIPKAGLLDPGVILVRRSEEWSENVVVLAAEMLRRIAEQARLKHVEEIAANHEKEAALGRYMRDMRHSFNNALTSVLGNAELILLSDSNLNGELREQIGTIRDMALNLHEMMQRFTSLEAELQCTTKESKPELAAKVRAASSGTYNA
jgi:signal transduction histidine kinase